MRLLANTSWLVFCDSKTVMCVLYKYSCVLSSFLWKLCCFAFAVDHTPTPTRFLRSCDEVGLFQEINHFDKAAEQQENEVCVGDLLILSTFISRCMCNCSDSSLHLCLQSFLLLAEYMLWPCSICLPVCFYMSITGHSPVRTTKCIIVWTVLHCDLEWPSRSVLPIASLLNCDFLYGML